MLRNKIGVIILPIVNLSKVVYNIPKGGISMSKISNERKATYYIGIGMMVLGFILFISVFFSVASAMNTPFGFGEFGEFNEGPSFISPVIGMVLMISGSIVMNIGARGTAGSGLFLDPDKAREDLKPFNEAKGRMINDVISNIDAVEKIAKPHEGKEVIKIRCRNCSSLNDEDARFCKACGREL
jgi:hypothetical protein